MVIKIPIYVELEGKSPVEVAEISKKLQTLFSNFLSGKDRKDGLNYLLIKELLSEAPDFKVLNREEVLEHMRKGF